MNISLDSYILGRHSSENEIRKHREFTPEGFQEKIWILFEGDESGEQIFDEICEQIFTHVFEEEENGESSVVRFETAMRTLNENIKDHSGLAEDFLQKNSFVIVLSVESQIHFTTLGTAEVYFIREQKVMHVSEGITAQSLKDDLFVNVASGELQNGDVLIFSTLRLLRYISHAQMSDIAQNKAKEIVLTLEEFIDSSVGGEIGVLTANGAPALPFDTPSSRSQKKPGQTPFRIPLPRFLQDIKNTIRSKVPNEVFFVILGILGLFLLWSGIQMLSQGINNDTEKYKVLLEEINTDIGIAKSMEEDGRKKEALAKLETTELKAKDAFHNSTFQGEASRYLKQITEMKDEFTDTTRISGKSLLDITAEYPNESLQGVFFFDEEMYIWGEKNLFRTVGKKIESVIPFPEEESITKGIPLEKKQQMVFLSDRGTVIEATKTKSEYSKTDDPASWRKGKDISFFDRNIYLLVPEQNEIFKYVRGNETFSRPSAYNKGADLSDAQSFTIDGNVYVLKPQGEVLKLLRGVPKNFEISGAPEEFKNADIIYTLPNLDLLIFADTTGKRIFIFKKNNDEALFQRQIFIDVEDEVLSGLWFDINSSRIILTGKKKVYEIPLVQ